MSARAKVSSFEKILATRPDSLDVLKSTALIVQHARSVKINDKAIMRAADRLAKQRVQPPAWNYDYHYFDGTARTVNYLFLLDALNFCFWSKSKWTIEFKGNTLGGYWALAASLKRAAFENPLILDAEFLARITPDELAHILRGKGEIPLFVERWRNVREFGTVLRDRWQGYAARLVESANRDATRLARLIAENFSSFNDIATYRIGRGLTQMNADKTKNKTSSFQLPTSNLQSPITNYHLLGVVFLKRAQILVADLWGAFAGNQWGEFDNIDCLTAFADYKLPQILRAWGILKYAPALAQKVDAQIELAAGSNEEIEIRAATLWAVEFLRDALDAQGKKLMSVQLDWILWETSQHLNMKPYHRARTIYY